MKNQKIREMGRSAGTKEMVDDRDLRETIVIEGITGTATRGMEIEGIVVVKTKNPLTIIVTMIVIGTAKKNLHLSRL